MFHQLYIQSEYSILQSSCKLEPLFKRLQENHAQAVGLADEGAMYGAIKFYQKAVALNIKPLIGMKINYVINEIKSSLILYAMNDFGYKNLMKIASRIKINNGTIDFEYLEKANIGLLAIVPFDEAVLIKYHQHNNEYEALKFCELLRETYSQFYIGLPLPTTFTLDFLKIYNFYEQNGFKLVALPKVSFLNKEDYDSYITLQSIRLNAQMYEAKKEEETHCLLSNEEIAFLYKDYPKLLNATCEIVSKCNLKIEFGKYQIPLYQEGLDSYLYLKQLCTLGLEKRFQSFPYFYQKKAYYDRLNYELDTIKEMGFCDYFLIVYDYVKFAKKNNILVGPGRGSAPASLVSYSLGITDVDPLYHHLLFERFLNKERISMPDIDIDFQDDLRDQVISYVGRRYGKDKVAHIATFGTFKLKLAINDCARVYKLSSTRLQQINKCLEKVLSSKGLYTIDLQVAIAESEELQELMASYEDVNKVLKIAMTIQGIPKSISTHAAGIIITRYDLVNYTPLDNGLDGIYQTQYEASDLEALGLLKMDFLGLKNLTNIANTINLIKQDDPHFVLPKTEDDDETYKMLARGDVSGVFQLESAGMRKVIMNLKTANLEDIVQALALYRPGPMDIIPSFIKRKFKEEKVIYPHPDLEPILRETYGMIVYQDQIMLIACKFAGYSLGRADILRRAVSKKKKNVLEEERTRFIASSLKQGYEEDTASKIYDYIVKFADYGFNKAHSVAYAKVAYMTAYLKCHYFSYYFSTLMTSFMQGSNLESYTKELMKRNVKVNGPDINKSKEIFTVIKGEIYYPLTIIKGLGIVKVEEIIKERTKGLFNSFNDAIIRLKDVINNSLMENLIYSGAFDQFGLTKKAMIESYQNIIEQSQYTFVKGLINVDYPTDEYNYGLLKAKELEILGINLKYNFFRQCEAIYQKNQMIKIIDIKENKHIRTMGVIEKVKETLTKQQEKMAFVEISDDTSKIEVVFFPKAYASSTPLQKGAIIMIDGMSQRRNDVLQVSVNYIKKILNVS